MRRRHSLPPEHRHYELCYNAQLCHIFRHLVLTVLFGTSFSANSFFGAAFRSHYLLRETFRSEVAPTPQATALAAGGACGELPKLTYVPPPRFYFRTPELAGREHDRGSSQM